MNFFTEKDLDELLHSTFFIKMCDDASWLYVEDHPFQPELNWLLSLWGGYKIAPRFQGEVRQMYVWYGKEARGKSGKEREVDLAKKER